jgi:hypothetical protein
MQLHGYPIFSSPYKDVHTHPKQELVVLRGIKATAPSCTILLHMIVQKSTDGLKTNKQTINLDHVPDLPPLSISKSSCIVPS